LFEFLEHGSRRQVDIKTAYLPHLFKLGIVKG
jgi:hypothetical protein